MDAKEFKAWFEGFCEGVGEAPTAEQWAKLKQKVGTLAGPFDKLNLPNPPQYPDGQRRWWEAGLARYDATPFPPEVAAQRDMIGGGKADG